MTQAIWNGIVLAQSDQTVIVEGNHYFPPESIDPRYFRASERHTTCPWKGQASYYDIVAGDREVRNAAWYYPEPKPAAANIRNYIAFYGMVQIVR